MICPSHDRNRLVSLVLLLLVAAIGRGRLEVDAENLAMKSVGTDSGSTALVREREFGSDPRILLLASPRAPRELAPMDEREIQAWIAELEERPEVVALEDHPTPNPGEHALGVTVLADEEGRYAEAVQSFSAEAKRSVPPTFRLAIAGVPRVEVAIAGEMRDERARILPIIAGTLALVLLLIYRHPVLVLGALLAPLTGVFLLEGLQGVLGLTVDPVSALLGPSILTVGVASSVHVLERYRHALRDNPSVVEASHIAAHELRVPLLLTVATTVAGFLGLLTSPIPAVHRFGLLASAGVVLAVLTTLLCLPSLLRLMHRPRAPWEGSEPAGGGPVHSVRMQRASGVVLTLSALVVAAGAYYMTAHRSDSDPLHVLSPDNPVRVDSDAVTQRLGGSEVFELLLPPGGSGGSLALVGLTARITALDGVVGPAGKAARSEGGYRLLTFLLAPGGSAEREALFQHAESLAEKAGWPGAAATGLAVRVARDSHDLVEGQRRGILLTLFLLFVVMAIGFRSILLGCLGLVPNLVPLVLVQGAMGALGRPLSVASSMIGVVMLGLVVDDTIHFLHAYRHGTGTVFRRVTFALRSVTRPIVVTTVVLGVGFSSTLFGELGATKEFGLLAVATLVLALLADLVLLPALLLWKGPNPFRQPKKRTACLEQPSTTS